MGQAIRADIPQTTQTRWLNPTTHQQRVILEGPKGKFAFVLEPGQERELDSVYDRAIQQIDCGQEECRKKGWWCSNSDHPGGNIRGGLAPLLKRVGKADVLDPSLDPALADKKMREAALAADTVVQAARDRALVVATSKFDEANRQSELEATRRAAAGAPGVDAPAGVAKPERRVRGQS